MATTRTIITKRYNSASHRYLRRVFIAAVANLPAVLGACGGNTARPPESSSKSKAVSEPIASPEEKQPANQCAKGNRTGNYHVQLQGISSTCKQVTEYEEQLKDGVAPLGADCVFDRPDKWSGDKCKLERAFSCKTEGGGSTRTILVSSQHSDDGSLLVGILSIRQLDKSGAERCQGTFKFIASRG